MSNLPKRQREIVELIRQRIQERSAPPTLLEIGQHFGIGISTAQEHVSVLESKGVIERVKSRARGIRLLEQEAFTPRSIPIMGLTTAGQPTLAFESHEGHLAVDGSLIKGERVFALKVQGDSMIEAGILDGDMAIIRQQEEVENGSPALVLVDTEEATIKMIYRRGRKVELRPANPTMESILLDARRVRIQGKVIGVFRAYSH
ncbi:MAG: transcriptional repressor LexA [Candidatus Alcyoniella australis]|nr:transcriptional repressor LexA [Candidatus Alcyoniella australis]